MHYTICSLSLYNVSSIASLGRAKRNFLVPWLCLNVMGKKRPSSVLRALSLIISCLFCRRKVWWGNSLVLPAKRKSVDFYKRGSCWLQIYILRLVRRNINLIFLFVNISLERFFPVETFFLVCKRVFFLTQWHTFCHAI